MKKLKAFFGSKYFFYWIMCSLGWFVGRWSGTGKFDESIIGGIIVGGIIVAIISFIDKSKGPGS